MSTSLYDLSVGSFLQMAEATVGIMQVGQQYCADNNINLDDIVAKTLHPDMAAFTFRLSASHTNLGELSRGLQNGEFGPPSGYEQMDYAGLLALTQQTVTHLKPWTLRALTSSAAVPLCSKWAKPKFHLPARTSFSPLHCPTYTSTPPLPTTFCVCRVHRWAK